MVGGPRITDPRGSKLAPHAPHQMIRGSPITHPVTRPPPSPLPSKMIRNFSDHQFGHMNSANGMALTLHKLGHYERK